MTAHFAGATARLVVDPVLVGAAAAGALVVAAATLLVFLRGARPRERRNSRTT
jgi:hypothetical protein